MAKVKYYVKENKSVGTHSFFAVPIPNGRLTFDEVCKEACENTTIEPSLMRAAVEEYMKTVKRNLLKGFRVPVGEQFLTVYPNLTMSVKDEKDASGNVTKVATASMVSAAYGKSKLGATVHTKFSAEFAAEVSWQKVDSSTGAYVDDSDGDDGDNVVDDNGGGSMDE